MQPNTSFQLTVTRASFPVTSRLPSNTSTSLGCSGGCLQLNSRSVGRLMESLANPTPTAFEIALLDALLAGDHPYLSALRFQRRTAILVKREWSTAGEFLTLQVQLDAPRVSPPDFEIHDVHFHMQGVDHPFGGALLFIRNGLIDFLETYSYVDDFPIPGSERDFRLWYYMDPEGRTERLNAELDWRLKGMPKDDSIPEHFVTLRRQLGL